MTRWHVSSDINISIESLTKKRFASLNTNKALKYFPHYACFILARKLLQGYENILESQWNDCFFLIRLYLRPNSSAPIIKTLVMESQQTAHMSNR